MLEIFTNMPKKSNFMPKSGNFGKICSTKLGSFYSEFSESQRNIDMLKNLQHEKYAKAYFAFP